MRQSIDEYVKSIDNLIKKSKNIDLEELKKEHLIKISFYQHERLIHLIVTISYAIFLIAMIALSYFNNLFVIILFILLVFLIFYVRHYFYLENHVQYMYKQYDMLLEKE